MHVYPSLLASIYSVPAPMQKSAPVLLWEAGGWDRTPRYQKCLFLKSAVLMGITSICKAQQHFQSSQVLKMHLRAR